MSIRLAESDDDILSCFEVMVELRRHLVREEFVERVRLQQSEGYQLVLLRDAEDVVAVAGFRITASLYAGRNLYVDDLVTAPTVRSQGHGQELFDWLIGLAREKGCEALHLDSGVHRFDAHRFYLRNRMNIVSHHFGIDLKNR